MTEPASTTAPPRSEWRATLLKAVFIVVVGAFALSPVIHSPWFGDDDMYIVDNPLLDDPYRIEKAWLEPGSFIEYYPITQTVQWIQWQIWGDNPVPFHVSNIVLHLLSALLVWRLLARLGLRFAWIGGLIFAVEPLFVDTMAAANELKNTLSLPPFLLAMMFYLDFERDRKPLHYRLALALFLIAMLCKITMAFFPVVILLYAWWKRGRVTWGDFAHSVPFGIISLVLIGLTLHSGNVFSASISYKSPAPIHLGGPLERLALAGLCLTFYLGRGFFPLDPLPLYPLWKISPLTPSLLVPWLVLAAIFVCCWLRRESWGRPILFALGFFVLGLAPFLGFNETSYMALLWVSDHFLYIPILAPIALAVAGLGLLAQRLPPRWLPLEMALVGLALGLLAVQTWTYSRLYPDPTQLWAYDEQYNSASWFPPYRLGVIAYHRQQMAEAVSSLQRSIRLNPDFMMAQFYCGIALCNTGRFTEGVESLRRAAVIQPLYFPTQFYLGAALSNIGRVDEAITALQAARKLNPDDPSVNGALGEALTKAGRFQEALALVEKALLAEPDNAPMQRLYQAILQARANAEKAPPAKPPVRH